MYKRIMSGTRHRYISWWINWMIMLSCISFGRYCASIFRSNTKGAGYSCSFLARSRERMRKSRNVVRRLLSSLQYSISIALISGSSEISAITAPNSSSSGNSWKIGPVPSRSHASLTLYVRQIARIIWSVSLVLPVSSLDIAEFWTPRGSPNLSSVKCRCSLRSSFNRSFMKITSYLFNLVRQV